MAAVTYVTSSEEKGFAPRGVDFWHILYKTFDATISTIENTYINRQSTFPGDQSRFFFFNTKNAITADMKIAAPIISPQFTDEAR